MTAGRASLLLLLTLSFTPVLHAAPLFTFESNRVAISGITPKAAVYAYSISRETADGFSNVVPREIVLTDEDGDGNVVWTLDRELAPRSLWLAVDSVTGVPAVATPPAFSAMRVELSELNLKKQFAGGVAQLAFLGDFVEFVVVRPGTGIWRTVQDAVDLTTKGRIRSGQPCRSRSSRRKPPRTRRPRST